MGALRAKREVVEENSRVAKEDKTVRLAAAAVVVVVRVLAKPPRRKKE